MSTKNLYCTSKGGLNSSCYAHNSEDFLPLNEKGVMLASRLKYVEPKRAGWPSKALVGVSKVSLSEREIANHVIDRKYLDDVSVFDVLS